MSFHLTVLLSYRLVLLILLHLLRVELKWSSLISSLHHLHPSRSDRLFPSQSYCSCVISLIPTASLHSRAPFVHCPILDPPAVSVVPPLSLLPFNQSCSNQVHSTSSTAFCLTPPCSTTSSLSPHSYDLCPTRDID